MLTAHITLTETESRIIQDITKSTGKTLDDVVHEAIEQFIVRSTSQDRSAVLQQARGMWKDRDDLPDFEAMRREWDRV
jgi:hypothetical protein